MTKETGIMVQEKNKTKRYIKPPCPKVTIQTTKRELPTTLKILLQQTEKS